MRTAFLVGVIALILFALPGVGVFTADLLGYGGNVNAWLEQAMGISHRLALGIPAAVVLFCVPPLIILLYFLRLQRKALSVPSTFLWKKSIEDLHVNRLMQWMRRNVLLLLQLLAAMVLLYAVLGPRLHGAIFGGRYFILLIDNSASMTATDVTESGVKNRLEWAKAEAIKEIEASGTGDIGMVIAFHGTAEIRQSYTASKEELKAAVLAIQPTQSQTRIDEALTLAASLANPARSTENEAAAPANPEPGKERTYVTTEGLKADVYLYSDGRFPPVPEFALTNLNLNWRRPPTKADFGRSDNVGIIRFDVERDPTNAATVMARAEVRNYRGTEAPVKVRLDVTEASTGRLINSPSLNLTLPNQKERASPDPAAPPPPPQVAENPNPTDDTTATLQVQFPSFEVPENADVLFTLRLLKPDGEKTWVDAFPHDDAAWLVFGVARKANVLIVNEKGRNKVLDNYFETPSALRLADFTYLSSAELADAKQYLEPALEGKFDLVIFDRCTPASEAQMPLANTLFIGQPPPPWKQVGSGGEFAVLEAKAPEVRVWLTDHPVMRNLRALDRVRISDAFKFPAKKPLPPRTPRLMDGDGDTVLLAALSRQTFTDFVLAFPLTSPSPDGGLLWHSDWPLQPSFVLFLKNLLVSAGGVEAAGSAESLRPGQAMTLRPRGAKEIIVNRPGESVGLKIERTTNRSDVVFTSTDLLGSYSANWGTTTRGFAVNLFDPLEGDLAPLADNELKIGAESLASGESRKQPRDLWKYLLVAGLLVVMVEWWVYNKRVQI